MTGASPEALPVRPAEYWDPQTPPGYDQTGSFNVFGYRDVRRVLTDAEAFSADYGITDADGPDVHPERLGLWMAGGRRHHDLRALIEDPFRRQRLEALGPSIRALADQLLDAAIARDDGRIDIVSDFARPFHLRVTCRILGLDPAHTPMFDRWIMRSAASAAVDAVASEPEETDFWFRLLHERRACPQDGLVDTLVAAQQHGYVVGDRPMTDWDLIGYFAMLLAAGYETASAISNAILDADTFGLLKELYTDRTLLPGVIEETLRWYPPFPNSRRWVITDSEIGGQVVKAGPTATPTWIVGWLTSANRDPARFPNPNRYDPRRSPNPHLTFGRGRRHCLGAPLARLEMTIALQALLKRLPGLRRDHTQRLERTYGIVDPLVALPCTFDAPGHLP
jgi:cytochrome P450